MQVFVNNVDGYSGISLRTISPGHLNPSLIAELSCEIASVVFEDTDVM